MHTITLDTPVVLIIFNRPHLVKKALESLRLVRPKTMYVIADAPRPTRPEENQKCDKSRSLIETDVSWECKIYKNYADSNMGCYRRVSSGLDWVFGQTERAIILEDDCAADPTFFSYCEQLLSKYEQTEMIFAISGNNFQMGNRRTPFSYYFSIFNHLWGWATWKRAWKHFDHKMERWPSLKSSGWLDGIWPNNPRAVAYWTKHFDSVHQGTLDSWGYRWTYSCWVSQALTVLPEVNLVSNVGFGEDATHTRNKLSIASCLPTQPMPFPLQHPSTISRNQSADAFTQERFLSPSLYSRTKNLLHRFF